MLKNSAENLTNYWPFTWTSPISMDPHQTDIILSIRMVKISFTRNGREENTMPPLKLSRATWRVAVWPEFESCRQGPQATWFWCFVLKIENASKSIILAQVVIFKDFLLRWKHFPDERLRDRPSPFCQISLIWRQSYAPNLFLCIFHCFFSHKVNLGRWRHPYGKWLTRVSITYPKKETNKSRTWERKLKKNRMN